MTTRKVVSKEKCVVPTAWHVPNPDYIGYISVGADSLYTDTFKTAEEAKAAAEAADADPDKKIAPEVENFVTTYYEFSGTFTTNLRNSTRFLQVGIGVSTQYDDTVMANVEMHQLSLRSEILGMMSEFSEEEIQGKAGRDALSAAIAEAINKKLIELEDFGGVESVHFTSFMLQ